MTREGHLEACVQTLLEEVHLLLLGVCLTGSVPHHVSEVVGVLLDLLGSLGNVVELFHFGIHHALGHVVLAEGFSELLLRDVHGVSVGVTVTVPPCACSASELVGGDPHALLISAGGEVHLLLHLTQLVLCGDGSSSELSKVGGLSFRKPSNFLWKLLGSPPLRHNSPSANVSMRCVWRSITSDRSGGSGGALSPLGGASSPLG